MDHRVRFPTSTLTVQLWPEPPIPYCSQSPRCESLAREDLETGAQSPGDLMLLRKSVSGIGALWKKMPD